MFRNRWIPAIAGIIVLLFAGMIYAWSTISVPIAQEFTHWTQAQLSLTFTLLMVFFCAGGLISGMVANRILPQLRILIAAALFLVGLLLSARIRTPMGLYLNFGCLCGFASGVAYNAALSTVGKWFPDKPGLISGILLMGFGLSAFLIGKAYQAWTPAVIGGWRTSFTVLAVLICAVLLACAPFLRNPGPDFQVEAVRKQTAAADVPSGTMLRRGGFWLFYIWAVLLTACGLALVSQGSGIAAQIGSSVSPAAIATTVGMISISNGVGRVLFGHLFDRKGRRVTMLTNNLVFIATGALLVIAIVTGTYALMVVGFILGGIGYGGVPPTNSAFVTSRYGTRYYPVNLAIVNTNMVPASVGSTVAGALFDSTGSYLSCCALMIVLGLLGCLFSGAISVSERKKP